MLLTYRNDRFTIPHTSTCVIHNTGEINDGDTVSVTSPVFASTNFTTGSLNMSEQFEVPIRINTKSKSFVNTEKDGNCYGTLVCDDNDVFNMYVRI